MSKNFVNSEIERYHAKKICKLSQLDLLQLKHTDLTGLEVIIIVKHWFTIQEPSDISWGERS